MVTKIWNAFLAGDVKEYLNQKINAIVKDKDGVEIKSIENADRSRLFICFGETTLFTIKAS
ncbi:MAG: hypothetical protein BTN85_1145 [Candidatus Methanohalarchaeum thermophilum]|uniref:Uncharacterized protein n=1 Tax=Methanohalarchaeum thermophilum TaxID=1903181 RepID=A0A1Q6DWD3_METT1|nr:MAG: hypothetical protein BTN85_1145 [Candidatus Methanohalarchaeum thermophilum]